METPPIQLQSAQSLFLTMRCNGEPLGTATGFVVQRDSVPYLITNWHVVSGRNPGTGKPTDPHDRVPNELAIMHHCTGEQGRWFEVPEPLFGDNKPIWLEHPAHGGKVDVAALPLTNLTNVQLYPYFLGAPQFAIRAGPADHVSVIGFPFGLKGGGCLGLWATGYVASEPSVDLDGLPKFLIDCRTRRGQSGSPVLAYRTGGAVPLEMGGSVHVARPCFRFMGVYSGRINEQSDLGVVWKVTAVNEVLGTSGPTAMRTIIA